MSEIPRFTETGEWVSPILNVGEYSFTFDNTELRIFGDGWAHLNHVEYLGPEGVKGMMVTKEMFATLMQHDFPYSFRPFPTQRDMDWFVAVETRNLEAELNETL